MLETRVNVVSYARHAWQIDEHNVYWLVSSRQVSCVSRSLGSPLGCFSWHKRHNNIDHYDVQCFLLWWLLCSLIAPVNRYFLNIFSRVLSVVTSIQVTLGFTKHRKLQFSYSDRNRNHKIIPGLSLNHVRRNSQGRRNCPLEERNENRRGEEDGMSSCRRQ